MSDGVNIETLLRSLDDGPQWPCKQAAFTLRGCLDDAELGLACRELGIETVEQLKAKMQLDPRVAVLEAENKAMKARVYKMIPLFSSDGIYSGDCIQGRLFTVIDAANEASKLIAAQRGEVEG